MPALTQIAIFPIKSLDGVTVTQTTVLESGALQHDREFAIVDMQGKFVNGKRTAAVHGIRSQIDLSTWTVRLHTQDQVQAKTFHLDDDRSALETWLSDYFGFAVRLIQDTQVGFPDDTESPGPTVISTETLQAIADWFLLSLEETRRRFRSNLEISGVEPFWEDSLFGEHDRTIPFHIGAVQFAGVNPCQRCVVVTRDAMTGESLPQFQKTFTTKRKETLPAWVVTSRFNHFFRLAVNTRTLSSQAGKVLRVGDQVMPDEA
ncbi:MAG: MOSC N-terminal beta barrel domain-containing protein [Stenomitos rutilans HA7619-LM2]|jgi:hypothetical protein|nr:MOSC N-terminal beta barrel domain-containing protein [Stenomitos rutilans HA7619-LM2]